MVYLIRLIWCSFKFFFSVFQNSTKLSNPFQYQSSCASTPPLTQSTDNELRSILGQGRGRCGVDQIMTMIETALCFLKKKEVERKKENRNRISIYFRRKFALISKFSSFVSQVNCSNPKIVSLDHVAQIIIRSFPVRIQLQITTSLCTDVLLFLYHIVFSKMKAENLVQNSIAALATRDGQVDALFGALF